MTGTRDPDGGTTEAFPDIHLPTLPVTGEPVVLLHGGNVANWMWQPQVDALRDRLVLTPDLPGFGARTGEDWPGLDQVADDVIDRMDAAGIRAPAHIAGLSLGATVTVHLLARHPDRVRSGFITGAALTGASTGARLASRLQLMMWNAPWFWKAQAVAFGLPADSRGRYVSHGLSVRRGTAAAMVAEVLTGRIPTEINRYQRPLLAIAGEKESASMRRSLTALAAAVPQAQCRLAPGMHHIWNVEDIDLFNTTLRSWLEHGQVDPRLLTIFLDSAARWATPPR